jgi:DNA-binding transcriptional LysR family regulator
VHLVREEVKSGRLVVKQTLEPKPGASMFIAWRSADRGKALRWFLDRLEDRKWIDSLLA